MLETVNIVYNYAALSHVLHCQEKLKHEEEAAMALRYADRARLLFQL